MSTTDSRSALLALLLMGDGLHSNDWGGQTNTNLQLLETAVAGISVVSLAAGSVTLTTAQAAPRLILLTGAPANPATVTLPAQASAWTMVNLTTSGQAVSALAAGQAAATAINLIPQQSTRVYGDGTNLLQIGGSEMPVGTVFEYDGLNLPDARYAWANGQALSRTTYPACFAALTTTLAGTLTSGQATVTVTTDLSKAGLVGAAVEGVGVPSGAKIVAITATQLTLSANATASGSPTLRLFPYGNGDGATTFNVRDRRDVASVGSSTMGNTAARGLLTTASLAKGANLGQVFGEDRHTLTTAEMPSHAHGLNDPGHAHGISDPGHAHTSYSNANSGAVANPNNGGTSVALYSPAGVATSAAVTGITYAAATTGLSVQNTGTGGAHNVLQPTTVCNYLIRVL